MSHWPPPNHYNPHVYVPPGYYNPYYNDQPLGWPQAYYDRSRPTSKWPIPHPALAVDMPHIRYDVRKPPRDAIMQSTWQQIAHVPALTVPTSEICIISKAFPWSIKIAAPAGSVVTCGAIFDALYAMLQEPIVDSEWGIVIHEKSRKEGLEKAAKIRQEKDKDKRLKRVDWLGDTPVFKGLEKDDEFEKRRVLPGSAGVPETWVVKFGKP